MVNKFMILKCLAFVGLIVLLIILALPSPHRDHEDYRSKIVLEMNMVPIDDSPGEYILEYSNGSLELLKKDGTRAVISPKGIK
jgi:hypothetical protein